jgi:hypothetical protein
MAVSENDKEIYYTLKKGYEGELMFDTFTEKLDLDCYIVNDLLLMVNNTLFQIDTLIICQSSIYVFEVKNYEGDLYFKGDRLLRKSGREVKNPLVQLKRCLSLLRQLLQTLGFQIPIEGNVVFINPECTIYQAPLDEPIIYPNQVNRYLRNFNNTPSVLNGKHKKLAGQLIKLHIEKSPYLRIPVFDYEQPRKGIACAVCDSFEVSLVGNKCVCGKCGHGEDIESAVLRNVREHMLLFPENKVTTNAIFEWCQVIGSKKRISRILGRNFNIVGATKGTCFIERHK